MAELTGEYIAEFAHRKLEGTSSLQDKADEEICYQDYKIFSNDG